MYVEKRNLGKNIKYYLSHSLREGKKVHKIRKYLGENLSSKLLQERKEIALRLIKEEIQAYSIIKDPLLTKLSEQDLLFAKNLEAHIPLRIFHLSEEQWQTFSSTFTYNTNAIEGSRLDRSEVEDILGHNLWPRKSREDIAEAYGVNEAIAFMRVTKEHVSVDLIKRIHKIIFKNSKDFAGSLRKKGEEVVILDNYGHVIHKGATQPRDVYLLKELEKWYNRNKKKYPALILAAVVHNQFENIHPFKDGNGRVGRILLNNILIKHGLPPMNIDFKNRMEYYASLQAYERVHDLRPTLTLFMKEYKALEKTLR